MIRAVMIRGTMLLTFAAVALAACGGDDADLVTGPAPTPSTSTTPTPRTSLTITVDLGDGSTAQERTLTCDPPGGTHPRPQDACTALTAVDRVVFEPVGPSDVCTQIYGGPETATVRGTWNGTPLDASFSRDNGCEIARWDAVVEILGAGTATTDPT
jgi:Subtilisin inhibitor-like